MKSKIARFRRVVWNHYRKHGRHTLPWRRTTNPYRVLVSEVMLQQTQVDRVIPYYRRWLREFPTARALSGASQAQVLKAWQGLGYNRRAKMLHQAAKALATQKSFPRELETLERLPGVGPYTARAVLAFAYNKDAVFVETNIRTAILHHFFTTRKCIIYDTFSDKEILGVVKAVLPKGRSREWYAALMDYGAHLKRSGIRLNAQAKGYTKQSAFKGSSREARGMIVRELLQAPRTAEHLEKQLGVKRTAQVRTQLRALENEGMILRKDGRYCLAE